MNQKSSLVLQEPPLVVLPSLACAVGLVEAIIVQQLYFLLLNPKNGRRCQDGERYVFNTYAQWVSEYFPFLSERAVQRAFLELEHRQLVISCQPDGSVSRRKYYRLNHGALQQLTYERLKENSDSAKLEPSKVPKRGLPLTETTDRDELNETRCQVLAPDISPEVPSFDMVKEYAIHMGYDPPCALRFYRFNEFNRWQTWAKHSKVSHPIRNWRYAFDAFAPIDRKRVRSMKVDPIHAKNDEFWIWARATFPDHLDAVRDWVATNSKRGWKQVNKMNGRMEPITDFKASVAGWVKWIDDNGIQV